MSALSPNRPHTSRRANQKGPTREVTKDTPADQAISSPGAQVVLAVQTVRRPPRRAVSHGRVYFRHLGAERREECIAEAEPRPAAARR